MAIFNMKKRIHTMMLVVFTGLVCISGQAADAKKVIKLFNGTDLNNWIQQKPRAWEAKDGVLGPSLSPGGYIWAKGNFAFPHNGWSGAGVLRAVFFVFTPTDRVSGIA